jgi:hypothetical protein
MNVVIVAARERMILMDGSPLEKDKIAVESLIKELSKRHGRNLNIISVGCDKGVGKAARDFCMANAIIFVECRMKLEGKDIPRSFFVHVFQARNPALVALGDEFYVFKGPNENGIVEGIIDLAIDKVKQERVHVIESEA